MRMKIAMCSVMDLIDFKIVTVNNISHLIQLVSTYVLTYFSRKRIKPKVISKANHVDS